MNFGTCFQLRVAIHVLVSTGPTGDCEVTALYAIRRSSDHISPDMEC